MNNNNLKYQQTQTYHPQPQPPTQLYFQQQQQSAHPQPHFQQQQQQQQPNPPPPTHPQQHYRPSQPHYSNSHYQQQPQQQHHHSSLMSSTTAAATVNQPTSLGAGGAGQSSTGGAEGSSGNGNILLGQKLLALNEQSWILLGNLAETLNESDKALGCFEHALKHNPYSIPALTRVASIYRSKDQFAQAADIFQRILNAEAHNGEIWGALGHCFLMLDDLQKAYNAYQQALIYLPNPKEPKLWYGIGILYDRYGSLEHAEEAFSSVLKIDPKFEKATEIYFRLGVIYKQQGKYDNSLQCLRYILQKPPRPLTEADILFQIGHVHELQKEFDLAREAYERVLQNHPTHAKVLQQLGWLYNQQNSATDREKAISLLTKSLDYDSNDSQSWYLLGRCYMDQQNYTKAYDAYQQAVYRDGRNPLYWCSIGVLYSHIIQYRDALDAYTRAIRLNPYISEVWYNLGTLYESCNNQIQDAIDAYIRASELDVKNTGIRDRLAYLKQVQNTGGQNPDSAIPPPAVIDINPNTYRQSANGPAATTPMPPQAGKPRINEPPGISGPVVPTLNNGIKPSENYNRSLNPEYQHSQSSAPHNPFKPSSTQFPPINGSSLNSPPVGSKRPASLSNEFPGSMKRQATSVSPPTVPSPTHPTEAAKKVKINAGEVRRGSVESLLMDGPGGGSESVSPNELRRSSRRSSRASSKGVGGPGFDDDDDDDEGGGGVVGEGGVTDAEDEEYRD